MKKNFRFFIRLFLSTFYISAFTFGGGFVIIPLLRKKFVEQYMWINSDEMLDLTAIAQSAPGAVAVNASVLIGYRLAGFIGAAVTVVATILPPLITLSIISFVYSAFRDSVIAARVLRGMQAGVAAVICDVVISMVKEILGRKNAFAVALMLGAFAASWFFNVNVIYIILICAVLGLTGVLIKKEEGGKK